MTIVNANVFLELLKSMTPEEIFSGKDVLGVNIQGSALIAVVVLAVLGAMWCFFGLKSVRFWSGVLGCGLGAGIGAVVTTTYFDLDPTVNLIISCVAGVICACLGFFLYRVGIFLVALVMGFGLASSIMNPVNWTMTLVCAGIGLVIALLTVAYAEPVTMIVTGVYGAVTLGTLTGILVPVDAAWVQIAAIAVFAVLGIWLQFVMESGKRKKRNLKKAAEIREQYSTANEVEKARAVMADLDKQVEEDDEYDIDNYDIEKDDDIKFID